MLFRSEAGEDEPDRLLFKHRDLWCAAASYSSGLFGAIRSFFAHKDRAVLDAKKTLKRAHQISTGGTSKKPSLPRGSDLTSLISLEPSDSNAIAVISHFPARSVFYS